MLPEAGAGRAVVVAEHEVAGAVAVGRLRSPTTMLPEPVPVAWLSLPDTALPE